MLSQLGIEGRLVQYLVALFIVLVLVGLFALVLRRITGGRMGLSAADRGRARQPRLGIVDVYDLDRQRQLVLLRRDNVEHLLLIGGPNDVVVETNIMRVGAGRPPQAPAQEAAPALPERVAPPIEAQPTLAERVFPDPSRERPAPEPVPEGPPRPILEPPVGARVNAPEPAPPPAIPQDPLGDLVERARTLRPENPLLVDANPAPGPRPAGEPAIPALILAPAQAAAPVTSGRATISTPRPPAPEAPPAPGPGSDGDAAVLSDMARQLEEALKRPAAPPPAPRPAPPSRPAEPARQVDPPRQAEPPRPAPPPAPEPVTTPPPAPKPAPVQPPAPRPVAPPPAAATPAPPPRSPGPPPGTIDPFSVDEIEAEFARLLGRSPDKN